MDASAVVGSDMSNSHYQKEKENSVVPSIKADVLAGCTPFLLFTTW